MTENESGIRRRKVAVIGGGMTGITAALELAKSNRFKVTLFEKERHLGGLSSYYRWKDVTWDRFYHVVLSSDTELLKLIKELGLQDDLFWRETKTGFYGEGKLVSFSSTLDFIRFPFLSLWQKFRLGLGILYSTRINDASKLDKIYVRQWLSRVFGRRVYESIWDPLLRSKLGDAAEKTSAAFIWATITRLYGARSSGSKKELMGHVRGGYHTILKAAEKKLNELGVTTLTNTPILTLKTTEPINPNKPNKPNKLNNPNELNKPNKPNKLNEPNKPNKLNKPNKHNKPNNSITLTTPSADHKFEKVLFTISCPQVLDIINPNSDDTYWHNLKEINYLGVICVILVLSRKLSPYYVTNLLEKTLPFTGIIEVTNIVSPDRFNNRHIVYLPKYITADNDLIKRSDNTILELFIEKLKMVFPDLQDNEILFKRVFREKHVQPLQEINYLDRTVGMQTPIPGVYLGNTAMLYNSTLNNNAAIKLAKDTARTVLDDFKHC